MLDTSFWREHLKKNVILTGVKMTSMYLIFMLDHDKPESEGGTLDVSNLKPICARCNLSMSNNYTIKQWNALNGPQRKSWCCL